ncbi:MAG: DUF3618 domain-containing protein [Chloroflexota bacterium]
MTDELYAGISGEREAPWSDQVNDDDAEIEAIAIEIEQTRDDMTGTVEAIGDRLDPANVVQGAKQTVRDATVGKVENVASNASEIVGDVGETAQRAGSSVVETIRSNPVPVALIAIGAGWLFMNRRSDASMSGRYGDRRWSSWDEPERGLYGAPSNYGTRRGYSIERETGGPTEQLGQTAEQVGQRAAEFADEARYRVQQVPDQLGGLGQDVQNLIQDNPLAAGALAVAVGTAIGLALPPTATEQRVLGQAGERLIDQAESKATGTMREMQSSAR